MAGDPMTRRISLGSGLIVGVTCALAAWLFAAWQAPAEPTATLKARGSTVKDYLNARAIADHKAEENCYLFPQPPALRGCKKAKLPSEGCGETEIQIRSCPTDTRYSWLFNRRYTGADYFEDPCATDDRKRLVEFAWEREQDIFIEKKTHVILSEGAIKPATGTPGPVTATVARRRSCNRPLKPRPDLCGIRPTGAGIRCALPGPRHARVEMIA